MHVDPEASEILIRHGTWLWQMARSIWRANKSYTVTIALINELAQPSNPDYNITEEVEEEADEHMFFFEHH